MSVCVWWEVDECVCVWWWWGKSRETEEADREEEGEKSIRVFS